ISKGKSFVEFVAEVDPAHQHWPNWFVQQNFWEILKGKRAPHPNPPPVGRGEGEDKPTAHAASIGDSADNVRNGSLSPSDGERVGVRGSFQRLGRGLIDSLWLNLRIGFRAITNTWILTLPAGLLWWFGWYDGWNNSFNKGYEQAPVGPLISIIGIIWMIAAMFYVPLAQARQAATGEWRSFFQFRLLWSIVRARALACI